MTTIAWFALVLATVEAPPDWSCDVQRWGDGICDCACTASDDLDCTSPCLADDDDDNNSDDESGASCAHAAPTWAAALALALLLRRRQRR